VLRGCPSQFEMDAARQFSSHLKCSDGGGGLSVRASEGHETAPRGWCQDGIAADLIKWLAMRGIALAKNTTGWTRF